MNTLHYTQSCWLLFQAKRQTFKGQAPLTPKLSLPQGDVLIIMNSVLFDHQYHVLLELI